MREYSEIWCLEAELGKIYLREETHFVLNLGINLLQITTLMICRSRINKLIKLLGLFKVLIYKLIHAMEVENLATIQKKQKLL